MRKLDVALVVAAIFAAIVALFMPVIFQPPAAWPIRCAALTTLFLAMIGALRIIWSGALWFRRQRLVSRVIDVRTSDAWQNNRGLLNREKALQQERRIERLRFYISLGLVSLPILTAGVIYRQVAPMLPSPVTDLVSQKPGANDCHSGIRQTTFGVMLPDDRSESTCHLSRLKTSLRKVQRV